MITIRHSDLFWGKQNQARVMQDKDELNPNFKEAVQNTLSRNACADICLTKKPTHSNLKQSFVLMFT